MRSPATQEVIQKIVSAAILTFGLVLSVAWTFLLGYGFTKLAELAIRLGAPVNRLACTGWRAENPHARCFVCGGKRPLGETAFSIFRHSTSGIIREYSSWLDFERATLFRLTPTIAGSFS